MPTKKAPTMGNLLRETTVIQRTRQDRPDINLPDESAGAPVGKLRFPDKSKDPLKQSYRDRLASKQRKKRMTDDDIQQEEQSRVIFGGDADDPRWDEHNRRVAAAKRKGPLTLGGLTGGK